MIVRAFCVAMLLGWAASASAQGLGVGMLQPVPGQLPQIAERVAAHEAVIIMPAQHTIVGTLQNDIRGTGLVNSDRVVMPRGMTLYQASFAESRGGRYLRTLTGWCGEVREGNRQRGYCMFPQGRGASLGVLRSQDSFYAPRQLADYGLRPVTLPEVDINPAARSELPTMEYRVGLVEWDEDDADLRQYIMVNGEPFAIGDLSAPRDSSGVATLNVLGLRLRVTPTPEGGATIERVSE